MPIYYKHSEIEDITRTKCPYCEKHFRFWDGGYTPETVFHKNDTQRLYPFCRIDCLEMYEEENDCEAIET